MKKSRQNVCKFESKKNYHHCTMYDLIGFRICADINAIPRLESGTSKWGWKDRRGWTDMNVEIIM